MADDSEANLKQQNKLINIIYYDADGYGSIQNTFDKARLIDPTLTYEAVKNWYAKNLIKKDNYKHFNSFIANHPKEEYQIDIMEMASRSDFEDSDKTVLVGVDIFTKEIQIVKLYRKSADHYLEALEKLIEKLGGPPEYIYSDMDPALLNIHVQTWIDSKNITLITTRTHAAVVERAIRTIKQQIDRRLDDKPEGDKIWWDEDFLDLICHVYNEKRINSTTHFTPIDAKKEENLEKVKSNLEKHRVSMRTYDELNVGDQVRRYEKKKNYAKEHVGVWSSKIYTIDKIERLSNNEPIYILEPKEKRDKPFYLRHELLLVPK
jgi:hypothetical protein